MAVVLPNKLKELTPKQVLAICKIIGGDGHTIFKPEAFLKKRIPEEVVKLMTRYIASDTSDPRSTIFNNQGQALVGVEGVHGLTFLKRLVSTFELTTEPKLGRGWEAREATRALVEHFTPLAKKGGKRVRKVTRIA